MLSSKIFKWPPPPKPGWPTGARLQPGLEGGVPGRDRHWGEDVGVDGQVGLHVVDDDKDLDRRCDNDKNFELVTMMIFTTTNTLTIHEQTMMTFWQVGVQSQCNLAWLPQTNRASPQGEQTLFLWLSCHCGLHLRQDKCQKLKNLRKCRTTWFASQKAKIASMRKRWQAWGENYCHSYLKKNKYIYLT